jgi:hypothetical protein
LCLSGIKEWTISPFLAGKVFVMLLICGWLTVVQLRFGYNEYRRNRCRSVLFWDVTQHVLVAGYSCFGTAYQSLLHRSNLSQNVSNQLPVNAVWHSSRAKTSCAPQQKPEIMYEYLLCDLPYHDL